jgi:hypothetical protein
VNFLSNFDKEDSKFISKFNNGVKSTKNINSEWKPLGDYFKKPK